LDEAAPSEPAMTDTADAPVTAAPPSEPDGPTQEAWRPLRILAAEDNATNQIVLESLLEPLHPSLTLVANGRQAIEAWREGRFDIVLMDMQMPGMDGVQAASEIRKLEAAEGRPRTPIIAVTANAMKDQVETYLAAGLDGHVAKPIDPKTLLTTMLSVMTEAAASGAAAGAA
jgi:CheY-like chemotaxis protein